MYIVVILFILFYFQNNPRITLPVSLLVSDMRGSFPPSVCLMSSRRCDLTGLRNGNMQIGWCRAWPGPCLPASNWMFPDRNIQWISGKKNIHCAQLYEEKICLIISLVFTLGQKGYRECHCKYLKLHPDFKWKFFLISNSTEYSRERKMSLTWHSNNKFIRI